MPYPGTEFSASNKLSARAFCRSFPHHITLYLNHYSTSSFCNPPPPPRSGISIAAASFLWRHRWRHPSWLGALGGGGGRQQETKLTWERREAFHPSSSLPSSVKFCGNNRKTQEQEVSYISKKRKTTLFLKRQCRYHCRICQGLLLVIYLCLTIFKKCNP